MQIKKPTKKQAIVLILLSLPSVAVLTIGLLLFSIDCIPTVFHIIMWIIVPVLTVFLYYLVLTSKRKTVFKTIISLLLMLFLILNYIIANIFPTSFFRSVTVQDLQNDAYFSQVFSNVTDNENHSEAYNYEGFGAIYFNWNALYYVCNYDEETYIIQIEEIKNTYVFSERKVTNGSIDGYTFMPLSEEEYDYIDYPKHLAFIITNDSSHQIIYLTFYDQDLDTINSFENFIYHDCGWDHVSKRIAKE
ncbi:MAG: hypothetical protein IJC45_07340 [Clostridia bacterium]|nr:hypothetical protein [Clostridia bacterium]